MTESDRNSPSPEACEDTRSAYRKSNKPLMEKRRRARINTCLSELKALVLQAMKKDNTQYSKLEKADILELTVKHLRSIQRHQVTAALDNNPNVVHKYRAGFNECANEVMRYLASVPGVQDEVKGRVLGHLANCMQTVNTGQISSRRIPVPPQLLHSIHLQHSSIASSQCADNPTTFEPIIRDLGGQLSSNLSCFTSTPIQLVQTSGTSPRVAFVLTSPPSVQAVPLYAASHSNVKVETIAKEESSSSLTCIDPLGDTKHSAFRDVIHGEHSNSRETPPHVELKHNDESMWRPW